MRSGRNHSRLPTPCFEHFRPVRRDDRQLGLPPVVEQGSPFLAHGLGVAQVGLVHDLYERRVMRTEDELAHESNLMPRYHWFCGRLLKIDIVIILIFMKLGEYAVAVGATKRWVQNARAALGERGPYGESGARRLAFAKLVKETCSMPLRAAYPLAGAALAAWPAQRSWSYRPGDGAVSVTVDLERFLSDYAARLSLSRSFYAERRRGRPRKRRGVALAKWYGVDVTLLVESLKLTPAQRLARLEEHVEFIKLLRQRMP